MTDIRKHLPLILTAIRKHVAEPDASEAIRARLRALLPASYGLIVSAQGRRSQPLDIVIYDTMLAPAQPDEQPVLYDARYTLAVIALAHTPDEQAARELLRAIASAKRQKRALHPHKRGSNHTPGAIPTNRSCEGHKMVKSARRLREASKRQRSGFAVTVEPEHCLLLAPSSLSFLPPACSQRSLSFLPKHRLPAPSRVFIPSFPSIDRFPSLSYIYSQRSSPLGVGVAQ